MESKLETVFTGVLNADEEEILCEGTGSAEDNEFDCIVGALEDILIDREFRQIQNEFCLSNCSVFDSSEENKIEYTVIFEQYTALLESALCSMLARKIPTFSMPKFEEMVVSRRDEISGEIFDFLLSLSDFDEFKEQMLAFKSCQSSNAAAESSSNLQLRGQPMSPGKPV